MANKPYVVVEWNDTETEAKGCLLYTSLPEERGNQIIEEIFGMGGIDSVNLLAQNS